MKTKGFLYGAALSAALLLNSCETHELAPRQTTKDEKNQTTANFGSGVVFNGQTFANNVSAALKGKTVGYIAQMENNPHCVGISSGYATYLGPYESSPAPYKPGEFWVDPRMETAQLSSTITAAAMLEVLEGKAGAVTVDSPIFPYLPNNWKLGPNVKLLTFRHLLTHGSGLAPGQIGLAEPETDRYENLRKIIANGIPATYIQDRNGVKVIVDNRRQSLNYALLRVLMPYVQYGAAKYKPFEAKNTNAEATAADYVALVQQLVLVPSGIAPKAGQPLPDVLSLTNSAYQPRFYQYGNMDNYWEQDAQGRLYAGANRWIMKSQEYMSFLNHLLTGNLLSPASLQTMKSGQMGMTFLYGQYGKYTYQKGYQVKNGAGLATAWMSFPNGLAIVLYVNTVGGVANDGNGTPDLQNLLKQAYDQAWEVVQ